MDAHSEGTTIMTNIPINNGFPNQFFPVQYDFDGCNRIFNKVVNIFDSSNPQITSTILPPYITLSPWVLNDKYVIDIKVTSTTTLNSNPTVDSPC